MSDTSDIAKLNALVEKRMATIRADVKSGKQKAADLSPEFGALLDGKTQVYHERYKWLTIGLWCLGFGFLFTAPNVAVMLACLGIMYLWYDLYSGVLHIVLDHPGHIAVPVLSTPCLEFQWHHHLPRDIVSKGYLEVCGDLNTVACILSVLHLVGWGMWNSPVGRCVLGCKLLMAYFGQYCHRMSHATRKDRPAAVQWLQDHGLMLSAAAHGVHHKTYDGMFCIGSGVCNPLLAWCLRHITSNASVWLAVFLVASIVDCVVIARLVETLVL